MFRSISLQTPLDAVSTGDSSNVSRLRGGWRTSSLTGRVGSSRPIKGAIGKAERRCYRDLRREPRGRLRQQRGTTVGPAKASGGTTGTSEGRRPGSIRSFPAPVIRGQRDPWPAAAGGARFISGGKLNAQRDGGVSANDGKSSSQDVHPSVEEEDKEECRDMEGLLAGRDRDGGSDDDDSGGKISRNTIAFTALASASILVSYADRGNLASTIVPMGEQFGWSPGFEGLVLSAFFVGYASTQVRYCSEAVHRTTGTRVATDNPEKVEGRTPSVLHAHAFSVFVRPICRLATPHRRTITKQRFFSSRPASSFLLVSSKPPDRQQKTFAAACSRRYPLAAHGTREKKLTRRSEGGWLIGMGDGKRSSWGWRPGAFSLSSPLSRRPKIRLPSSRQGREPYPQGALSVGACSGPRYLRMLFPGHVHAIDRLAT